jgi:hypothetical protein
MRVSGSDKSRSPVARKWRRSALYLSGAIRLACSNCRPARVMTVTARLSRRLAMRHEVSFTGFIQFRPVYAPGLQPGVVFCSYPIGRKVGGACGLWTKDTGQVTGGLLVRAEGIYNGVCRRKVDL